MDVEIHVGYTESLFEYALHNTILPTPVCVKESSHEVLDPNNLLTTFIVSFRLSSPFSWQTK